MSQRLKRLVFAAATVVTLAAGGCFRSEYNCIDNPGLVDCDNTQEGMGGMSGAGGASSSSGMGGAQGQTCTPTNKTQDTVQGTGVMQVVDEAFEGNVVDDFDPQAPASVVNFRGVNSPIFAINQNGGAVLCPASVSGAGGAGGAMNWDVTLTSSVPMKCYDAPLPWAGRFCESPNPMTASCNNTNVSDKNTFTCTPAPSVIP